ncbi:hypothetical protein [Streptomyces sp. NPDC085665]
MQTVVVERDRGGVRAKVADVRGIELGGGSGGERGRGELGHQIWL